MTPAARLQAAIELLESLKGSAQPADRLLRNWARGHRFAGSKDRAAIKERVFGVLRNRAQIAWAMGDEASRPLILGSLVLVDGMTVDEATALFDGSKYGPEPVSEDERAGLAAGAARAKEEATPLWATANYPEWLHGELEGAFGASLHDEMIALGARAPVDLRVNALKTDRTAARAALAEINIDARECSLSPVGLRLDGQPRLDTVPLYREGLVEVQDEGSQVASLLAVGVPAKADTAADNASVAGNLQVADLCAGAGGKTLAMAAALHNRGQVFAWDIDARRLSELQRRAKRAGAHNVQVHTLPRWDAGTPDPALAPHFGQFDRVLLDVPCTGSGAWRRHPEAKWRLTPEALAGLCDIQATLLTRAGPLVKPGGQLTYVTCSVLPSENSDQISRFLGQNTDFELEDGASIWNRLLPTQPPKSGDGTLLLTPRRNNTDGFYIAIMRRRGLT